MMRALLTRPRENADSITAELAERDIEVLQEPLLDIRPIEHEPVDLEGVQAVLVTSPIGARTFAEATPSRDVAVYAVGDATADILREAGFKNVESARGDATALATLISERLDPKKGPLLHASGRTVAAALGEQLTAAGFEVRRVELYAARPSAALSEETIKALREDNIDIALFFSPRTAETFTRLIRDADIAQSCASIRAFCLSEAVATQLRELEWADILVAERPEQSAMLERIDGYLARRSGEPTSPVSYSEAAQAPPHTTTTSAEVRRPGRALAFVAIALSLVAIIGVLALWNRTAGLTDADDPNAQAIADLQAQVQHLTATAGDLQSRLEQVGGNANQEIERRISELETTIGTKLAEIEGSAAATAERLGELSADTIRRADLERIGSRLDEIAGRLDRELSGMQEQIEGLRGAVATAQRTAEEAAGQTTAAAMLALGQLEAALQAGRPFEEPLSRIRQLVDEIPGSTEALQGWGDRASRGIPTLPTLKDRFTELVKEAGRQVETGTGSSWLNQAMERASSIVSIRRVGDDVEGDSKDAILARAEAAIGRDDLAGAVAEIGKLSGAAAETFSGWLTDARARLAATAGIQELENQMIASAGGRD